MDRIRVYRSKKCINVIMEEVRSKDTPSKVRSISAEIQTVDENYLEKYTNSKASENPLASTLVVEEQIGGEVDPEFVAPIKDYKTVCGKTILSNIDTPILESNFVDSVRGNVLKTNTKDSLYRRQIRLDAGHNEIEDMYIGPDVSENVIENPFAGCGDISKGASMSFWLKVSSWASIKNRNGMITFLGEIGEYEHPDKHHEAPTIMYQPILFVDCVGNIKYSNAWHNGLYKGVEKTLVPHRRIERAGKNWEHFIISFTDDDVIVYLNGERYDVYIPELTYRAKRFNKHENMMSITRFLSKEDTKLLLGVTCDNELAFSEACLFDDIMFYAEPVDDDTAKELYEEALLINLP